MGVLGREFIFSDRQFNRLRTFIAKQTGIALTQAKKDMVYARLSKHIRSHYGGDFKAFCDVIEHGDQQEQEFLINAITTNLTAFFREAHHFDYLQRQLIPALLQRNANSRKLRIWSAGCSTGEEPYSIAMCLAGSRQLVDWDIRILATDLDANVLNHARAGIFTVDKLSKLPQSEFQWFQRGSGTNNGLVRLRPELREIVTFKRLNLLHDWPMQGPFDLIFCRNVVIYFDKQTQARLFDRFADLMVADGHLFIGHSESLYKVSDRFTSLGNTIYRRSR